MANFKNVDVLETDWTSWMDMSPAAQEFITDNLLSSIGHEDESGEPLVTYVLPAGSLDRLENL